MNTDWAARNLHIIRTLMERSALYRRALAPVMLTAGCIGLASAVLGFKLEVNEPRQFVLWWLTTAVITCTAALYLVRKQALADKEPIWSPPARRVLQAALPPFAVGLLVTLVVLLMLPRVSSDAARTLGVNWLTLGWTMLYGCGLHAAGFFLPRGMKVFGWSLILGACALFASGMPNLPPGMFAHGVMGFFFGILHQAYGVYLYLTERKEDVA